jgi:Family of unknown function (DUF6886)
VLRARNIACFDKRRKSMQAECMELFHFSDDPRIEVFEPRPVRIPASRSPEREWLNGPLVWAIDRPHSILYLFPRDCPRIVIWPTERTTDEDRSKWIGSSSAGAVAFIEAGWLDRVRAGEIYRYEMPADTFENTQDAGMWVSRMAVRPNRMETLAALDRCLSAEGVELRSLDRLTALKPVWDSTLHASGIRLRNAMNWPQ